ncbi:MAG: hypothetical protein AAFZ18_39115 [Myxococcota bacterium]
MILRQRQIHVVAWLVIPVVVAVALWTALATRTEVATEAAGWATKERAP